MLQRTKTKLKNVSRKVFLITLTLFVLFNLPSLFYHYGTRGELLAEVTGKERVCKGGEHGECKWMVLTTETSFKNVDSWYYLKFNSSDVQGKMKDGGVYRLHYYGWRIPFLSVYPNLTSVEKIEGLTKKYH